MKKNILLATIVFSVFTLNTLADFSDVSVDHESFFAVKFAEESDYVKGYSNNTFKPDQKVTRAEFIKIIIEAIEDPENKIGYERTFEKNENASLTNCFTDVNEEWYAEYICKAKEYGLVDGYSDNTFKPNDPIKYVEVAKIIYIALGADRVAFFIGDWYSEYVEYFDDNKFAPSSIDSLDKEITRIELVEMIYRISHEINFKEYSAFILPQGSMNIHYLKKYHTELAQSIKENSNNDLDREKVIQLCAEITKINLNSESTDYYMQKTVYANQAIHYLNLGYYQTALDRVEKSLTIDSEYTLSLSVKGSIFTYQNKFADAELYLNKAIESDETYAGAYYNKAILYAFQNREKDAIENRVMGNSFFPVII